MLCAQCDGPADRSSAPKSITNSHNDGITVRNVGGSKPAKVRLGAEEGGVLSSSQTRQCQIVSLRG
jgi:hypothetical protein